MTLFDRPLILGTRGSPLALAQAHLVRAALVSAHPGIEVMIAPVISTGDKIQDRALADVGGKALWTKELDQQLLNREIDFAVHSMKDVETIRPPELTIAAMLPRADVRDVLIGADSIDALPHGAVLGTSAPRRTAQMLRLRPDLKIILFRGNVDTRLRKVRDGEADATLLAAAGLDRLGKSDIGTRIPVETLLPAPSQGAVGIEARSNCTPVLKLLSAIDHLPTRACVLAERGFLAGLNADCHSPVAALAQLTGDVIHLSVEIMTLDGTEHAHSAVTFDRSDTDAPRRLAKAMLERASPKLRSAFG